MVGLDAAQHARAEELLKQATSNMLMTWKGYGNQVVPMLSNTIHPALKGIADVTDMVGEATERTGEKIEQAGHEKWGRFKDQVAATGYAIADGANEIRNFGREIGITNPELDAMITGIGKLAEGIGGIASGNLMQGIASGIAGLQGIVGTLFGNSPAEQARRALLRANTEGLEKLRAGIGDLMRATTPGGKLASFADFANEFTPDAAFDGRSRGGPAQLAKELAKYGLTIADLNDIAKQEGVDFDFNKFRGGADMEVLNMVLAKIKASEYGQFGQDTFGERQDVLARYFKVAGITDPGQQARFTEAEIAKFSPFLADLIKQFDIDTPEGRAGLQQAFAGILQRMDNGTFDEENFGHLTGAEFVGAIESFTELLGEMGGGFPAGGVGTASPFPGGAPTTSAPVTVTQAAAVELLTPIMETAANTRLSAEELTRIRALMESGAFASAGTGGVSVDALDAVLQASRDLSNASGVAA